LPAEIIPGDAEGACSHGIHHSVSKLREIGDPHNFLIENRHFFTSSRPVLYRRFFARYPFWRSYRMAVFSSLRPATMMAFPIPLGARAQTLQLFLQPGYECTSLSAHF
jgi:hypothetical protein